MEDNKIFGVVFVDLQKAFDHVKHRILIKKLRCCGMDDLSGQFWRDERASKVSKTVLWGTAWINSGTDNLVVNHRDSGLMLSAGDTVIVSRGENNSDVVNRMADSQRQVEMWSSANNWKLNVAKTVVYLHITRI